jgi:transglutaminase-like putative cysteine protease
MTRYKSAIPASTVFALCTALSLSGAVVRAEEQNPAVIARTELTKGVDTIRVEADGTYIIETEDEITLLDQSGLKDFSTKSFAFNDQHSSVEVITAETIKKDGRHIPVKAQQIRLQEEPAAIGAPVFTTSKIKTIIFPDIAVGDRIHYRIRKTNRVAAFPGYFSYSDYFSPEDQVSAYRLVLSTPEDMALQVSQLGLSEDRQRVENGRRIQSWTYQQPRTRIVDDNKANMFFHEPHFLISSFGDWKKLAIAYQDRAKDKVVVTPAIQKLADDITFGTTDRREQTRKLYDWVSNNIRYLALYLADGGYVPHQSEDILHNRYGDCKDHVVLLEALLKARGIESYGTLISSGTNFQQSPIPVPALFDHIITYVPELNLYLDSTQPLLPFGELGFRLSSKPALPLGGSQDIVLTPPLQAGTNRRVLSLKLDFQSDGTFTGHAEQTSAGGIGHYVRSWIGNLSPLAKTEVVARALARQGLKGTGTLQFDPPAVNTPDYHTQVDFHVTESSIDFSRPEAFMITAPVDIADSIADLTSFSFVRPDAQFPTLCMAADLTDTYDIYLPEQTEVLALPRPVELADGALSYKATYQLSGNRVQVNRHFVMTTDRGYCTPEEVKSMTPLAKAVQKDLSARLLVAPRA